MRSSGFTCVSLFIGMAIVFGRLLGVLLVTMLPNVGIGYIIFIFSLFSCDLFRYRYMCMTIGRLSMGVTIMISLGVFWWSTVGNILNLFQRQVDCYPWSDQIVALYFGYVHLASTLSKARIILMVHENRSPSLVCGWNWKPPFQILSPSPIPVPFLTILLL